MTDLRLVHMDKTEAYPLMRGEDLYNIDPPLMLIDDLLPQQSVSGLTSYPGTGKTWFALELVRAISTGGKFLGKFQAQQGSVLFVGSDASIYDYARQWRKLTVSEWSSLAGHDINPLEDGVRFLIQSDFLFESLDSVRKLIKTSRKFHWGELSEEGFESGFSLIIFDTLSKLTRASQSDNTQMEEVFRNIRLISEATGAGVMLLHHNSKQNEFNDGEDWRGASAQIAALDNWFQINLDKMNPNARNVLIKKFRGLTPDPFSYLVDFTEESAKLTRIDVTETNAFEDGIVSAVVEFLSIPTAQGGWFSVQQIANGLWPDYNELFGGNLDKFTRAIRARVNRMVDSNPPLLRKTGGGKRSIKAEYTLYLEEKSG